MMRSTSPTSRCCPARRTARPTWCPSTSAPRPAAATATPSAPATLPIPARAARSASRITVSMTAATCSAFEAQAAQVTKYSLQSRYVIPIGDPAAWRISACAARSRQAQLPGDVTTTHAARRGPSVTAITERPGSTPCGLINGVRTSTGVEVPARARPSRQPAGAGAGPGFACPRATSGGAAVRASAVHRDQGARTVRSSARTPTGCRHTSRPSACSVSPPSGICCCAGKLGATLVVGVQPAAHRVPLLRRRRQQCAWLCLQRPLAVHAGVQ